ncbi:nodulin-26-like [Cornus florida]|uniref:nodulin-26-like n=1 Tax=Cornus florida TaxID=4283 RepID=UPI00289C36BF|nr:nodulin-26-like [Cornus florida]
MAETPSAGFSISPKRNLSNEISIMMEKFKPKHPSNTTGSPSNFQKIVAELVGTYILIFAGCGAALVDRERTLTIVGIAVVWGSVLMAMIYALGHISGAHFNPAVTIAFASASRLPLPHVPMYVVSQLLGSTLACLTLRLLFNDQDNILPTLTQYSASTTDLQALAWEFIISFTLMFTICGVATDHRANKQLSGVAIGGTVLLNVMIAGPVTGASMNPARSIGPAVVSGVYKNIWVFVAAPIIGAMAATFIYSLLRLPEPNESNDTTKSINNDLYLDSIQ